MSRPTAPLPDWEVVLSSAARLQRILPDAVLVGGTAAALHAGHRFSRDADHVLRDLRRRFDEVLTQLESVAGWRTARVARPVRILGSLDGIETGVRQLIRDEPLETTTIEHRGTTLTLPRPHRAADEPGSACRLVNPSRSIGRPPATPPKGMRSRSGFDSGRPAGAARNGYARPGGRRRPARYRADTEPAKPPVRRPAGRARFARPHLHGTAPERRPTGHQDAARTGNGFRDRPASAISTTPARPRTGRRPREGYARRPRRSGLVECEGCRRARP